MKLTINITQTTDGRYRAICPSLPGCISYGRSSREAWQRMEQAVFGYLASLDVAMDQAGPKEPAGLALSLS